MKKFEDFSCEAIFHNFLELMKGNICIKKLLI